MQAATACLPTGKQNLSHWLCVAAPGEFTLVPGPQSYSSSVECGTTAPLGYVSLKVYECKCVNVSKVILFMQTNHSKGKKRSILAQIILNIRPLILKLFDLLKVVICP